MPKKFAEPASAGVGFPGERYPYRTGDPGKSGGFEPMRATLAIVGIRLCLAGSAVSLQAHHSFAAEFDANKPVTLKGTVTTTAWTNPHVWIHVDVKKPDGSVEKWAVECSTPSALFRRGFTKQSLLAGIEILIDGYQAKDGTTRARGRDVTFPGGRRLFLGGSGTGAPYDVTPDNQNVPSQK
jgi:hypothetical protein